MNRAQRWIADERNFAFACILGVIAGVVIGFWVWS